MMWDLKTTETILGMRTRLSVSIDMLKEGGDEYVKHLASDAYREIQQMAYSYAAELHIEDMVFRWEVEEVPDLDLKVHTLRARWEPSTHGVLMLGGDMDGQRFQIDKDTLRKHPIRVARAVDTGKLWGTSGEDPVPSAVLPSSVVLYHWSGWEDAERIWTYTLAT